MFMEHPSGARYCSQCWAHGGEQTAVMTAYTLDELELEAKQRCTEINKKK